MKRLSERPHLLASKTERGLLEFYQDPERADATLWSRRGLLKGAFALTLGRAVGAAIPYLRFLPAGLTPVALAQSADPNEVVVETGSLRVLNDRPFNAETPAHLLDDEITPANRLCRYLSLA